MRKIKAIAILIAMVMAAGLMASPAYAGEGAWAGWLETPGTLDYESFYTWGCSDRTAYIRAFNPANDKVLAEEWHGDFDGCESDYLYGTFNIGTPVPKHIVLESWALYLDPGFDKAANQPGSLFWRLVNIWAVPSPSIAYAGEMWWMPGPTLPLPQDSALYIQYHLFSSNILPSTRAAVFENPDDTIVLKITNNGPGEQYFTELFEKYPDLELGWENASYNMLEIIEIGVDNPIEPPFKLEGENCTDIEGLEPGDTCEIFISYDADYVAAAGSTSMNGLYAKAGLGTSILLIGFVLSSGGIRRRRLVAAVIILALIMGIGMLQACGDENKYIVDLLKKPHYVDTFEITSNDPDEPSITIGVGAYKNY